MTLQRLRHGVLGIFLLGGACAPPPQVERPDVTPSVATPGWSRPFVAASAPEREDWLRVPPKPLAYVPARRQTIVEQRLANGIRLIVVPRPDFPSVALTFVLDRGSCDGGAAAWLYVHSLFSGESEENRVNHRYLRRLGIGVEAHVTEDTVSISTKVLPPLVGSAIAGIAPVFLGSELSTEDVDDARRRLKESLADPAMRQQLLADRALRQALFGRRAYGNALVEPWEVDRATEADVREFRQAALAPGHVTVVAVGDTTPEVVARFLEKETAKSAARGVETSTCSALPVPPRADAVHVVDDRGAVQSHIRIGALGVPFGHSDAPALEVLSAALGGLLSSRLQLRIREEHGLTYGVTMRSYTWRGRGLLNVSARVETSRTGEALAGMIAELDRATAERFDDVEIDRAKLAALPDLGAHDHAAAHLVPFAAYGAPASLVEAWSRAILAVTPDDVLRVAKKYLAPSGRTVAIVGDVTRIAGPVEQLGMGKVVVAPGGAR